MPLYVNGEKVVTAHGSKKSKVKLIFFEAHTSVLVPLLLIPVFPFGDYSKAIATCDFDLILLERRGITLGVAYKKIKSSLSGRYRYSKTRHRMIRRIKLNKQS